MNAVASLKTRIATVRLAETRDWYCDLLGLRLLEEWDEPGDRGCILGLAGESGEAFLEICESDHPGSFEAVSLQFRVADVGKFMIPDRERFAATGPVERPWGSRYLFFTDPNGILVVVFSGTSL